ncbi:MAG: peptide deformylase, partial [Cyanobacteria bacterium HKST-UBA01]|nr:peptide deformylase [Cyanobacteria bacterium HKST-UBA01]
GIAAPQANIHQRIIVVDVSRNPRLESKLGLVILVNPVVVKQSGKSVAKEGCLSLPELIATVRRAKKVVIEGFDAAGQAVSIEASGFDARALLHEIDHLDGILFLDRVSSLKTDVFRRRRPDAAT